MTTSLRLAALRERLQSSLFFVPMLFVAAGATLGVLMVRFDAHLDDGASSLPFVAASTVDSAREILGVVASATITVAGIAFSVALLVIQQASSQYSPRAVQSIFRDPFNRRVMGLSLGTFTYALMVLRTVRSPLESGGEPVVPDTSVAIAVVLGVGSILAIVAFIDHNAHAMEVSQLLHRLTEDAVAQIRREWPDAGAPAGEADEDFPSTDGYVVPLPRSGWVQQISASQLLDLVEEGGVVRLATSAGRYAIEGSPLCTIWPPPDDRDQVDEKAASAIEIGPTRTMQQDLSYGVRQLADIALVALSPGVNDPTTAADAIFHLGAVLREVLVHHAPRSVHCDERGRRLICAEQVTREELVDLAFDEVRRAATPQPALCVQLLEAIHLLDGALAAGERSLCRTLRRQAELIMEGVERAELLPADKLEVARAFESRFGSPAARVRTSAC